MTNEAGSDQEQGQMEAQATKISSVSPEIMARISKLREIRQRLGEPAYRQEWKRLSKDEARQVLTALTLLKGEAEPSAKIVQRSIRGVGMIIWPIKMTLDAALAIHDEEAHLDSAKR